MRIAIAAENKDGLYSPVSHHFGRCPCYALIDLEGDEIQTVQAIDNPFYAQHQPGQVPAFIHAQGVDVMISGGMGQRAIQFFGQFGIDVATGAVGTVQTTLGNYLRGDLRGAAPCRESEEHHHHH